MVVESKNNQIMCWNKKGNLCTAVFFLIRCYYTEFTFAILLMQVHRLKKKKRKKKECLIFHFKSCSIYRHVSCNMGKVSGPGFQEKR